MGSRVCPSCGYESTIEELGPIWPADWTCPICTRQPELRNGFPLLAPALADTISGFDPHCFEGLAATQSGHFWFEPRNRLLLGLLKRYFPNARSLLEIGCGDGWVLSALSASRKWDRIVGSELHPTGLVFARDRLKGAAELVQMDARDIPVRDTFDVVGAFDVLEHIEDDVAVIAAMRRALKENGGVLLAVPQHPWLWSRPDEIAHHVRRYRRDELEGKLRAAGFRILFSGSYTTILLPLMILSRLMQRQSKDETPAESGLEARPPALINFVLRVLLNLEVGATLAGLRLPMGGSRVIVATKI